MASRRELALENLRAQNQATSQQAQSDLADRNDARHQARGFSYEAEKSTQDHSERVSEIQLKGGIDLAHDKTIENLRHTTYALGQIQAKALADYETQARINHTTPDHYEKTTDGRIVIWNKDGSTRGALGPDGQFIPSGESISESDDGGVTGTVSGERASRTGSSSTAAPKPSAAKKAPDGNKGSALSQLAKLPPPPGGRVGATATGPNGLKATWNGKMWVLADVNG
jgi:hypothetical protein